MIVFFIRQLMRLGRRSWDWMARAAGADRARPGRRDRVKITALVEVTGSRLLRNAKVQAAISAAQQQQTEKLAITVEDVLSGIARLARADIRKLFEAATPGVALMSRCSPKVVD
jgi:hypothetical protein